MPLKLNWPNLSRFVGSICNVSEIIENCFGESLVDKPISGNNLELPAILANFYDNLIEK